MGPLAMAGAVMVWLANAIIPGKRGLQSTLGAGVLLVLGTLSWQRAWAFENESTLWTDTLAKNPDCWVGYNNLGLVLFNNGQLDEAMVHFQKSLEINPNNAEARNNLGIVLVRKGRADEAMAQFQKAVEASPNQAKAYNNLGNALLQKG